MGEVYSKSITSKDPRPMFNGGLRQRAIDTIVVHHNATTNKDVALNTWLVSAGNWTSAHYEITDNEIIGAVGENYVAYHAGGTGGADVPKMSDPNGRSIGLEHVNSTGAPSWGVSDATLRNSARLIADICKRYNLPINRNTIKLHREVTSTACPGGLDIDKLIRYAQQAAGQKPAQPSKASVTAKNTSAIQAFKNASNEFTAYGKFRVDEVKNVNGIMQLINYGLAGGKNFNWTYNGIPWALVDNTSRSNSENVRVGDYVKFDNNNNTGTVDDYDNASNGVGIKYGDYGEIWFDATAFSKI
ncbi:BlyA [Leuconostoc kimchii IMSNU 11154]|uniref:N-acetylmuramoyl-L-alanine amidase n=1 Tax=Leuconostoc kimchii (strain IMSNU 11154 / KCTC 2386 / IH25) TaxID=762051 RepID=D5T4M1_LEUKI|nr:N-acetylmuramoyl-L-alanine amidase [Leuconostoc kimchii]ADG41492.1 BlyA [Leuconostoc kimchii IMSNU 11154]